MTMEAAVFDACILYSAPLRDFLLRLASAKLVRPFWSEEIHAESRNGFAACSKTVLACIGNVWNEPVGKWIRSFCTALLPDMKQSFRRSGCPIRTTGTSWQPQSMQKRRSLLRSTSKTSRNLLSLPIEFKR